MTVASQKPTCTRCENVLDTSGYPLWCRKCRASNQREYEKTRKEMLESRGYAAGVSAMRAYLADKFQNYGTQGSFSGIEIAHAIRACRGPFDQPDALTAR